MPSSPRRTLLEPGHEAEWAKINEEDERQEAEFRATKDSDLLVPDGAETDEAILRCST